MFKCLIICFGLLLSTTSFGYSCSSNEVEQIDSKMVHAGVYSRDHMNLQFVLVLKNYAYKHEVRFYGGENVSTENLSSCPEFATYNPSDLAQPKSFVTSDNIFGYNNFSARYRICEYKNRKLLNSYTICNSETGD